MPKYMIWIILIVFAVLLIWVYSTAQAAKTEALQAQSQLQQQAAQATQPAVVTTGSGGGNIANSVKDILSSLGNIFGSSQPDWQAGGIGGNSGVWQGTQEEHDQISQEFDDILSF